MEMIDEIFSRYANSKRKINSEAIKVMSDEELEAKGYKVVKVLETEDRQIKVYSNEGTSGVKKSTAFE